MTAEHRPTFSFNPASWPISTKVVAVILAVSLAPMLLTAYYNTSSSLEALRDIELRSQRQIAGNVAGRIGQLLNDTQVATGSVVAGQIGALDRCIYTVIEDAVNVAARLAAPVPTSAS